MMTVPRNIVQQRNLSPPQPPRSITTHFFTAQPGSKFDRQTTATNLAAKVILFAQHKGPLQGPGHDTSHPVW